MIEEIEYVVLIDEKVKLSVLVDIEKNSKGPVYESLHEYLHLTGIRVNNRLETQLRGNFRMDWLGITSVFTHFIPSDYFLFPNLKR